MQNNNFSQELQNKKVGVVIPIYNVAEYLRECLDSVINQTYKNLSIVLVNDGSTDNNESLNIAKEYVAKDSRFILIDKENGGQSTARNVGIEWFSGKYETRLDSTSLEMSAGFGLQKIQNNNTIKHINNTNKNMDRVSLDIYNITNKNPYNIYKIYANNSNITQNAKSTCNTNATTQQEIKTDSVNLDSINSHVENTCHTKPLNKVSKNIESTQDSKEDNSASIQDNKNPNPNNTLQSQKIDYIIFLDSDDYWKPYTIEECIKHSDGVDIVWFDWEYYFDNIKIKKIEKTYLQHLGFKLGKITPNDLFDTLLNKQLKYFAWVIQGIIDFKFLQKINLYFYDGVFAEDHLFGALLFLQAKSICIIPEPFYIYRIRSNSSCNFDSKYIYVPRHFEKYCDMFGDRLATRKYYEASSWFLMLVELREFIKNHPNSLNDKIEQFCLPYYSENSLRILDLRSDPFDLIAKISEIEPYLKKGFKYRHKLRITNPAKYNRLKPLFNIYDSIKGIERTIRKVFKKEKD